MLTTCQCHITLQLQSHISDSHSVEIRKAANDLFNDAFNTFYFTVVWRRTYLC